MRLFAAFLLSSLLFVGCAQSPRPQNTLRTAQESDASTLDPAKAYDTTSIQFVRVLYRGLVDFDQRAQIYPEIARSYKIAPDGLTYTFQLRSDAKFADGTPVTSDDFRFTIERVFDPKTASDGVGFYTNIVGAKEWIDDVKKPANERQLKNIKGIECPNPNTLVFRLLKPEATFLANLALPFSYAVSRAHVEKLNAQDKPLSENPNGCGPFQLKEWVHDGWMILERNPNFYRRDQPKLERIHAQFGVGSSLQIMLFEQGNIDTLGISDAFPPDFLRLSTKEPWKRGVEHAPMMDIRYMTLNNEIAPFTDKRVRQAFNHAINRARIIGFLTGRATLAKGPIPPNLPAADPTLKGYEHDPNRAKALLQAAKFRDTPSAPIPLLYPTNEPWYGKAAQSIQADLKAVGVSVKITPLRYGDLKAQAGRRGPGGARMALMGWLQDYPDASNYLDPLFNARSIAKVASLNRSFYSNPRVNTLLDEALGESDIAKRQRMYREAQRIIVDDAPVVFLHHTERYVIRQPWVKGPMLHPAWSAVYEQLSVD